MEENSPAISTSSLAEVRLIVKSANQQFDDLIIHSEPTWTIRRLKAHLTQVYPSNPTVPEQKLIYSGQLLSDELILKDILRSYKDVETENHIFHLVYTPKMSSLKSISSSPQSQEQLQQQSQKQDKQTPPPIPSTSTDGLRHRNVASSSSTSTAAVTSAPSTSTTQMSQQTPNIAANSFTSIPQMTGAASASCPNSFHSNSPAFPNVMQFSFPGQFNSEHQAAVYNWVQQVYSNYMDQCLRMANAAQMPSNAPSIPMFMPPPQYMPQIPTPQLATASSGTTASSIPTVEIDGPSTSRAAAASFAPRVLPVIPTAAQPQPAVAAAAPQPVPPPPAPAPAPPENVEQPQPRFPNIVQEEQENRDWLDRFYSITRLLALLTLVYFYSSPLRCLAVALIAVGIYLYHTRFFQTRRPVQTNNNRNINNNQNINDNNAPAAENAVRAQEREPLLNPTPGPAVAGDAAVPNAVADPISSSVTPPETEPSATSLIAFVRTFVVSFFASLLPETPAL